MANFDLFVGVSVEDKKLESRQLRVFLRELLPHAGGELKDNAQEETYNIKDDQGNQVSGSVKTSNHVVADYFGLETNRAFPPDIVKGEQVLVFKYEGEDKYYWVSFGRDDNLRRGELLRWQASDDMSEIKNLNEANTYFMELDTKVAKRARIHTSKSDGEAFIYDITIDSKNNTLIITDDINNTIVIKSDEERVTINNSRGSVVNLNKSDIEIFAPRNILIRAGNTLTLWNPCCIGSGGFAGGEGHMTRVGATRGMSGDISFGERGK